MLSHRSSVCIYGFLVHVTVVFLGAPKLSDAAANMSTAIPPLACLLADSRHVLVLCMERQIRTFILPSQGLYQKLKLQDQNTSSFATFLKASVQRVKGECNQQVAPEVCNAVSGPAFAEVYFLVC